MEPTWAVLPSPASHPISVVASIGLFASARSDLRSTHCPKCVGRQTSAPVVRTLGTEKGNALAWKVAAVRAEPSTNRARRDSLENPTAWS